MYYGNVNVDLMEKNVIQINGGVTIKVKVNVINVMYVKKIIFGIILFVIAKMQNIKQVLWMIQWLPVMKLESHTRKKQILMEKASCKKQNFYILLVFSLITIALLTAVNIYCYLIKYWAKQKHLSQFRNMNNELKEVLCW